LDKKEEILKTALKLFVEFGFHATPTSKIAKEAGVANGTLFHYYKTKDDLILALFTQSKTQLNAYIYKDVEQASDKENTFKSIYTNTIEWALNHKDEFYFIQQFTTSPFYSLVSTDEISRQAKPHLDFLQEGIQSGTLKPLPVEMIYTIINSHISGITQYISSGNFTNEKQKQIISESFLLLWDMLT